MRPATSAGDGDTAAAQGPPPRMDSVKDPDQLRVLRTLEHDDDDDDDDGIVSTFRDDCPDDGGIAGVGSRRSVAQALDKAGIFDSDASDSDYFSSSDEIEDEDEDINDASYRDRLRRAAAAAAVRAARASMDLGRALRTASTRSRTGSTVKHGASGFRARPGRRSSMASVESAVKDAAVAAVSASTASPPTSPKRGRSESSDSPRGSVFGTWGAWQSDDPNNLLPVPGPPPLPGPPPASPDRVLPPPVPARMNLAAGSSAPMPTTFPAHVQTDPVNSAHTTSRGVVALRQPSSTPANEDYSANGRTSGGGGLMQEPSFNFEDNLMYRVPHLHEDDFTVPVVVANARFGQSSTAKLIQFWQKTSQASLNHAKSHVMVGTELPESNLNTTRAAVQAIRDHSEEVARLHFQHARRVQRFVVQTASELFEDMNTQRKALETQHRLNQQELAARRKVLKARKKELKARRRDLRMAENALVTHRRGLHKSLTKADMVQRGLDEVLRGFLFKKGGGSRGIGRRNWKERLFILCKPASGDSGRASNDGDGSPRSSMSSRPSTSEPSVRASVTSSTSSSSVSSHQVSRGPKQPIATGTRKEFAVLHYFATPTDIKPKGTVCVNARTKCAPTEREGKHFAFKISNGRKTRKSMTMADFGRAAMSSLKSGTRKLHYEMLIQAPCEEDRQIWIAAINNMAASIREDGSGEEQLDSLNPARQSVIDRDSTGVGESVAADAARKAAQTAEGPDVRGGRDDDANHGSDTTPGGAGSGSHGAFSVPTLISGAAEAAGAAGGADAEEKAPPTDPASRRLHRRYDSTTSMKDHKAVQLEHRFTTCEREAVEAKSVVARAEVAMERDLETYCMRTRDILSGFQALESTRITVTKSLIVDAIEAEKQLTMRRMDMLDKLKDQVKAMSADQDMAYFVKANTEVKDRWQQISGNVVNVVSKELVPSLEFRNTGMFPQAVRNRLNSASARRRCVVGDDRQIPRRSTPTVKTPTPYGDLPAVGESNPSPGSGTANSPDDGNWDGFLR